MFDKQPDLDEYRSVGELQRLRHDVHDEMLKLERGFNGTPFDAPARDKFVGLNKTKKEIDDRIGELQARQRALVEGNAGNSAFRESAEEPRTINSPDRYGDTADPFQPRHLAEARERRMRAIEAKHECLAGGGG